MKSNMADTKRLFLFFFVSFMQAALGSGTHCSAGDGTYRQCMSRCCYSNGIGYCCNTSYTGAYIGSGIGTFVLCMVVIVVVLCCWRRRRRLQQSVIYNPTVTAPVVVSTVPMYSYPVHSPTYPVQTPISNGTQLYSPGHGFNQGFASAPPYTPNSNPVNMHGNYQCISTQGLTQSPLSNHGHLQGYPKPPPPYQQ